MDIDDDDDFKNDTKIFVFSSNMRGIHGAGSAKTAREQYGARLGVSHGRTGMAYAIPVKHLPTMRPKDVMTLDEIRPYVVRFILYAEDHPELTFYVVKIGCGLAGYKEEDIAPLFINSPKNVQLPPGWRSLIQLLTD